MNELQFDATEMNLESIRTAMAAIPPERLAGIQAVIQINILETPPRIFSWSIQDGASTIQPGAADNPSLIIEATAQDFYKIITGKLSPMAAASLGRLQVSGNMQLAMSMVNIFRKIQESPKATQGESAEKNGTEARS